MSDMSARPLAIQSVDPRTGVAFGPTFTDATPDQVDTVVASACQAAPTMARMSPARISSGLARLADALDVQAGDLARLADHGTALGLARLTGEVARTSGQLRMFAALTASGEHLDIVIDHPVDAPARDLRRLNVPLGPVVVFGASNFPFAFSTLGGDTAAALAAACPVIVKAHPAHPQLSWRVTELASATLSAAGWPADAITSVNGASPAVGQALARRPGVHAVAFTGSTTGGRALFDVAASRPHPIPVYAEMGSLNPVVLVDVTAEQAASWAARLAASVTLGWGQFCTKPGIIAVPRSVANAFVAALQTALGSAEPAWALTAGIASAYQRKLDETAGLLGGRVWVGPVTGTGHAVPAATAVADVEELVANSALAEEHFGPFTLVVTHDGPPDIARIMGHLEGNLTATVITGIPAAAAASDVIEVVSRYVGRIVVNGVPTGVTVTAAQMHGGPYPSSTSAMHTSVGAAAIRRFLRSVAYQDVPDELLPPALAAVNPLGVSRIVDGRPGSPAHLNGPPATRTWTDTEHPADTEREDQQ